jgi:hypothetical protein
MSENNKGGFDWLFAILVLLSAATVTMWFIKSRGWVEIPPAAFWAVAHTTTVLVVIYLIVLSRKK